MSAPIFVVDTDLKRARQAVHVLQSAQAHGFNAEDYGERALNADIDTIAAFKKDAPQRIERLAALDIQITTALLSLGRDVALGRSSPDVLDRRWRARRDTPDLVGAFDRVADSDLDTWPNVVRPVHPEYAALQKALMDHLVRREAGGWPEVGAAPIKPGDPSERIALLRKRLAASGELAPAASTNTAADFDDALVAAVKTFQERHAIAPTGIADAGTVAAMNVSIDDRIAQLGVNLERWRWMPDELGQRHFLVNIPAFLLMAREGGRSVKDIRVVVGKNDGHETPIFSGDMSTVVFSPYWNIPDSIAQGETLPALAREPQYLERNHIEVLRMSKSGATVVDPDDVDWKDASEVKALSFRQRPGADNALGHVKFLFPNAFDVYLHDTPADALFARPRRAFSHGCIRVEEPEALAQYVLRGDSSWDEGRIKEAMLSGVERHVKLDEVIPVHIVYFTNWVDEAGALHAFPDAYGYDARQRRAASARATQ